MKKTLLLFGAIFLLFATINSANALSFTSSYNGHEYELVITAGITWIEASAEISTKYGSNWHLATIGSPEEESFIGNFIASNTTVGNRDEYWLGGFQDLSFAGEKWDWVNDEGTFWNNGLVSGVHSNFWGGEPNNTGGSENWLVLDYRTSGVAWAFNDEGNTAYIHGYIAESAPVPEPTTMLLLGTGLIGLAGARRKFKKK
jgi:hypothetical protein